MDRDEILINFALMEGKDAALDMIRHYDQIQHTGNYHEAIYGNGGWHRYFVRDAGRTVYFSITHCCPGKDGQHHIDTAHSLGFSTHWAL